MRCYYIFFVFCLLFPELAAAREVNNMNEGWTFRKGAHIQFRGRYGFMRNADDIEKVNLPHTWNTVDYLEENGNYERTTYTYHKMLNVSENDQGKRFFLQFEGAQSLATLFVNGEYAGEHAGGYNSFTFEITDYLEWGKENDVSVVVSNFPRFDIAPISGDFNLYGGLYRDVWLIKTEEKACISPLYYGSNGVLIQQHNVSEASAGLSVDVHLSTSTDYNNVSAEFELYDAADELIASVKNGEISGNPAKFTLSIDNPHLWNGTEDPYLYKAVAILKRNGTEIDRVEDNIGFRYYSLDPDKGFFLNGKHYKLRGVCRHQDWDSLGSAITQQHHLTDLDMISEMGANALRLAHYPQAKFLFREADRRGMVVWEEIPFVSRYINSEAFDEHLKQQLKEMIIQNYNHPSIIFWGLFNEVRGNFDPVVREMNDIAHTLDPSRITVAATDVEGTFNHITDAMAWNKYFGWYYDRFEDFATFFDNWHAEYPSAKIAISEYGAGASIHHHVPRYIPSDNPREETTSRWHPEERQTVFHITHIKMITERDYIWGSYIWNMFDFGSAFRKEGDRDNLNDKGLVTYNRQEKKDAFYLYKANWNKQEHTTHICSKRYTERDSQDTDIIVFTSDPVAQLSINGKKAGSKKADKYGTAVWENIQLNKGENHIVVKTKNGEDQCTWFVK